jgi:hypothetical protein
MHLSTTTSESNLAWTSSSGERCHHPTQAHIPSPRFLAGKSTIAAHADRRHANGVNLEMSARGDVRLSLAIRRYFSRTVDAVPVHGAFLDLRPHG